VSYLNVLAPNVYNGLTPADTCEQRITQVSHTPSLMWISSQLLLQLGDGKKLKKNSIRNLV